MSPITPLSRVRWAGAIAAMLLGAAAPPLAAQDSSARELFTSGTQPACGLCHVLSDAGTQGRIGPNLDELDLDEQKVRRALTSGPGAMPNYVETLSKDQIDALARYVANAAGG